MDRAKKAKLAKLFEEMQGAISYDGSACDLIKELRSKMVQPRENQ